jgi:hypothetical protein
MNDQTRIGNKKEPITMIQIGQKIDDLIDDFEFEVYQNEAIKKVSFPATKENGWFCCSILRTLPLSAPTELEETAEYYDQFKKEGAEILSSSTDTVFVHKAWHDNSPSIAKIAYPMVADPTARLCRYFGTYMEDVGLSLRGDLHHRPRRRSQSHGHPRQQYRTQRGRNSPQAPSSEFCTPASRRSLSGELETRQKNTQAGIGPGGENLGNSHA